MTVSKVLAAGAVALAIAAGAATTACSSDDDTKDAATTTSAAADGPVVDYDALLIEAGDIELPGDTFTAPAPAENPAPQLGASTLFTNADGTRQIGIIIAALPDEQSALTALDGAATALPSAVAAGEVQDVEVGSTGHMIAGDSPEAGKSITVVVFQEGNTFTTMQFEGALGDPVPADWAIALANEQADKIEAGLPS